jgi:hypothetical protein
VKHPLDEPRFFLRLDRAGHNGGDQQNLKEDIYSSSGGVTMCILWHEQDGVWQQQTLQPRQDSADLSGDLFGTAGIRIAAFKLEGRQRGVLLLKSGASVRVNGDRVSGGLCVLEHRDEILVGTNRLFYSDELKPELVTYASSDGTRSPKCPVCRAQIQDGDQVVQCPRCRRAFHQIDAAGDRRERHCWTYRPHCLCEHPTDLSGASHWRPPSEEDDDA